MYFTCCKKPQNGHRPISGVPRGSEQGRDEQGQKVQDLFHRCVGGNLPQVGCLARLQELWNRSGDLRFWPARVTHGNGGEDGKTVATAFPKTTRQSV